jgi:hypothetical protein
MNGLFANNPRQAHVQHWRQWWRTSQSLSVQSHLSNEIPSKSSLQLQSTMSAPVQDDSAARRQAQ